MTASCHQEVGRDGEEDVEDMATTLLGFGAEARSLRSGSQG